MKVFGVEGVVAWVRPLLPGPYYPDNYGRQIFADYEAICAAFNLEPSRN
jgi:hypothetical protein